MDGSGLISMTFDETMKASSFDPTGLTLQNAASGATSNYTLTGGNFSTAAVDDSTVLTLVPSKYDLDNIKRDTSLCTADADTFISHRAHLVSDMSDNSVVAIGAESAMQTSLHTPDTTPPELVSFDLDLNAANNTALLRLSFSETINAYSIDWTDIILQNHADINSATQTFALTNSGVDSWDITRVAYATTGNVTEVTVTIHTVDLNAIKVLEHLAINEATTFLSCSGQLIVDMNDNQLVDVNGQQVSQYVPDTTAPVLITWDMDLDNAELRLTFDEAVNRSTIVVDQLTLFNGSLSHTLHGLAAGDSDESRLVEIYNGNSELSGGQFSFGYGVEMTVSLTVFDLNIIKALDICTYSNISGYPSNEANDCNLSFVSGTVVDMNDNVVGTQSLQATLYTADATQPYLIRFQHFNMSSGILELVYNEPIATELLTPSAMAFHDYFRDQSQDANPVPLVTQTVLNSSALTTEDVTVIIQLDVHTLNAIKYKQMLCI
jgi:hypothetical protein